MYIVEFTALRTLFSLQYYILHRIKKYFSNQTRSDKLTAQLENYSDSVSAMQD